MVIFQDFSRMARRAAEKCKLMCCPRRRLLLFQLYIAVPSQKHLGMFASMALFCNLDSPTSEEYLDDFCTC
eukprot:s1579_g13.t1